MDENYKKINNITDIIKSSFQLCLSTTFDLINISFLAEKKMLKVYANKSNQIFAHSTH